MGNKNNLMRKAAVTSAPLGEMFLPGNFTVQSLDLRDIIQMQSRHRSTPETRPAHELTAFRGQFDQFLDDLDRLNRAVQIQPERFPNIPATGRAWMAFLLDGLSS